VQQHRIEGQRDALPLRRMQRHYRLAVAVVAGLDARQQQRRLAERPFAAGGVIASPVAFPLGGGRTGIAGERGPEAIMPLSRGPDGRLGVKAGNSGDARPIVFNVTTPDADSFRRSESQVAAMLARAVQFGQRNL